MSDAPEDGTEPLDAGSGAGERARAGVSSAHERYRRGAARADDELRRFGWYAVARKEFQDTIRSMRFVALSLIFVILFALPPVFSVYLDIGQASPEDAELLSGFLKGVLREIASVIVPLIGIVVGYASITRERESGTLKLLLSQPNSRRDVVLGKLIGRSLVVAIPIFIGFLVTAMVMFPSHLVLDGWTFLLYAMLTALLGVVFVGLGVGVSAGMETDFRSMVASVGIFVYLTFFWTTAARSLGQQLVEHADISQATELQTVMLVRLLNPTQAYKTLVESLYSSAVNARVLMFGQLEQIPVCNEALGGTIGEGGCEVASLPLRYSDPLVLVYMLLWLAVPVALGYLAFREADL